MRRLIRDNEGDIPGLPLELMIIALVMLMVIPTVWSISNYYRSQNMEDVLLDELSKFKRTAQEVERMEPGNVRTVQLSMTSISRIDYVRCGGENPYSIRYRLKGERESIFELGVAVTNLTEDGPREIELPLDRTVILLSRASVRDEVVEVRIGELS
ncbi:MAG: hypothetical protein R6U17_03670 [Thermoplasmata archaeon]